MIRNLITSFGNSLRLGSFSAHIPRGGLIVLLAVVVSSLAACVERPKLPLTIAPPGEQEHVDTNTTREAEARKIKREAFSQLQPLIRRFDRKKMAYEISEKQYLEKLYLWTLTFSMLELRSNPGTFSGDLPEHEAFAYSDFAESAEALLSDLTVYLDRYAEESDPEWAMLTRKKNDVGSAVQLVFPGTGSRLQDAIVAMQSTEFKGVVDTSNKKLVTLGGIGGKHIVDTFVVAAGKAIDFFNTTFHSQNKTNR